MPTTFISVKEPYGFWINEIFMEVAYEYIHQALNEFPDHNSLKEDLEFNLKIRIERVNPGLFTMTWTSFIKKEDYDWVVDLLEEAKNIVLAKGEYIPASELNEYEEKKINGSVKWYQPLKTSEVIRILDAMIQLFNGEWQSTNEEIVIDYLF